jgi:hypothetical protein
MTVEGELAISPCSWYTFPDFSSLAGRVPAWLRGVFGTMELSYYRLRIIAMRFRLSLLLSSRLHLALAKLETSHVSLRWIV